MSAISTCQFITYTEHNSLYISSSSSSISICRFSNLCPSISTVSPHTLSSSRRRRRKSSIVLAKSSDGAEISATKDEWLTKLPEKNKPLYAHSLPCVEAWLKSLGFNQSRDDRAVWFVEKPDWHAHLSLDVTELHIRYLKTGPGNLEKDVERRFSYALSREDIEKAILGGP